MRARILNKHEELWSVIMARAAKLDKNKRDRAVNILNGKVSKLLKSFDSAVKPPADHGRNGDTGLFQKHVELQEKKLARALSEARRKAAAMLS